MRASDFWEVNGGFSPHSGFLLTTKGEIERNLAALAGDVQSPLGPQEQQEEGKSEVQQGTQVDDQESNWRAPVRVKRFKVEDEGGDIDGVST